MKKQISIFLVLAMCFALLAGCSSNTAPETTAAVGSTPVIEAATAEPIRIGLSTPITGSFAENGLGTEVAVNMAVEEINANGGINGRPLEIVVQDSKSDPTQAAQIATMFTEDASILAEIGDLPPVPVSQPPRFTKRPVWFNCPPPPPIPTIRFRAITCSPFLARPRTRASSLPTIC